MNLQELSDAWNNLRNDALGRGTQPLVSAALAQKVGNTYERFKVWLGNAGVIDDVLADALAHGWVDQYRDLAKSVQAEGKLKTAPLPTTFGEIVATTAQGVANLGSAVILIAAAIGLPLLFVVMGGARARR